MIHASWPYHCRFMQPHTLPPKQICAVAAKLACRWLPILGIHCWISCRFGMPPRSTCWSIMMITHQITSFSWKRLWPSTGLNDALKCLDSFKGIWFLIMKFDSKPFGKCRWNLPLADGIHLAPENSSSASFWNHASNEDSVHLSLSENRIPPKDPILTLSPHIIVLIQWPQRPWFGDHHGLSIFHSKTNPSHSPAHWSFRQHDVVWGTRVWVSRDGWLSVTIFDFLL